MFYRCELSMAKRNKHSGNIYIYKIKSICLCLLFHVPVGNNISFKNHAWQRIVDGAGPPIIEIDVPIWAYSPNYCSHHGPSLQLLGSDVYTAGWAQPEVRFSRWFGWVRPLFAPVWNILPKSNRKTLKFLQTFQPRNIFPGLQNDWTSRRHDGAALSASTSKSKAWAEATTPS